MSSPAVDGPIAPTGSSDGAKHHVVIVGGGAAGLELATQLGDRFHHMGEGRVTLLDLSRTHLWKPLLHSVAAGSLKPSEHELDYLAQALWHNFRFRFGEMRDIRIILVEASSRILPALPERMSASAHDLLRKLGVQIQTGDQVAEVKADGIRLANGEFIPAELVVWAAGVKAPDGLRAMGGLETNRINQLIVTQTLQTTRDPNIFAMGDCAECPRPGFKTPVPPRAQAAHQQASHLFRQIQRHMRGKPPAPYIYRDFGSLVSLGRYQAIGSLMGFLAGRNFGVEGLIARLIYRSLYKMHEYALSG